MTDDQTPEAVFNRTPDELVATAAVASITQAVPAVLARCGHDYGEGVMPRQRPPPDTRIATAPASARSILTDPSHSSPERRLAWTAQRSAPRHPTEWPCWLARAWCTESQGTLIPRTRHRGT